MNNHIVVLVSGVGKVHSGSDKNLASAEFKRYAKAVKAIGQSVTMIENGVAVKFQG